MFVLKKKKKDKLTVLVLQIDVPASPKWHFLGARKKLLLSYSTVASDVVAP